LVYDFVLPSAAEGHIRRLSLRRDLEAVADLVELCFDSSLDSEGRSYLRSMREAARNAQVMGWTDTFSDHTPTPQTGLVWEQDGRLIGNVSLIPITVLSRRCYLIANVAVHPDYRSRGIGRMLTSAALDFARTRHVPEVWLQVRHDNPPAVHIYQQLAFTERTRRTTWRASDDPPRLPASPRLSVGRRRTDHWPEQLRWFDRLYPPEFAWSLPLDRSLLRPDWFGTAYRFFSFEYPRHWAVQSQGRLEGVLTWRHLNGYNDPLWLAVPDSVNEEALLALLVHARQHIPRQQPLSLNLPAGLGQEALLQAGLHPTQTLIWMQYRF
jgi:ribosomal protein S18 acetylase RimI-like enzyme